MSAPLRKLAILLLLPLAALVYFLGAYFFYYRGGYDAPPPVDIAVEDIVQPRSSQASFSEVPQIHEGTLLVDAAHRNGFEQAEISTFLAKVASRGYRIELLGQPANFGGFRTMNLNERTNLLERALR